MLQMLKNKTLIYCLLARPRFPDGEDDTNVDVNEGSPLHIHCKIVAVPMPELAWYKDGNPIESDDDVYIFPGGRTLQIISAKYVYF